jgi:hypothetical protein
MGGKMEYNKDKFPNCSGSDKHDMHGESTLRTHTYEVMDIISNAMRLYFGFMMQLYPFLHHTFLPSFTEVDKFRGQRGTKTIC